MRQKGQSYMLDIKKLKQMESPYLHDMFKSVLAYDAERVKEELRFKIGGKLLTRWKLVRTYQEILGKEKLMGTYQEFSGEKKPNPKADVVWLLTDPDRHGIGYRSIIHEVKTGQWSFEEVVGMYKRVNFLPSLHTRPRPRAVTTNTPLYIWSWKKYHPRREEIEDFFTMNCNRQKPDGSCRVIQLDMLLPFLKERLEEVFEWE